MIRIQRSPNIPPTLLSDRALRAKSDLRAVARRGKPKSETFPKLWGEDDVREALWTMQFKKCAYCERLRDHNRESDIEHFRPKADVTDAPPEHKGYWWLAYEWENLLFSCRLCNQQYKKNLFPIPDEASRAFDEGDSLENENAYLIDPCKDLPEQHFQYIWWRDAYVWIAPYPDSERGRRTIAILALNRQQLLEERAETISTIRPVAEYMLYGRRIANDGAIADAGRQIREETKASKRFAGLRRQYFMAHGLSDYISAD